MSYDESAASALRMISEKGRSVTIRRPDAGQSYDPANDTMSAGAPEEVVIKVVFTGFKINEVDGELIRREDKRVLIAAAALPFAPAQSDLLIDGGVEYSIINTETVQPGDVPLLYKVQVRK